MIVTNLKPAPCKFMPSMPPLTALSLRDTPRHQGMSRQLIEELKSKGIVDPAVLQAMWEVPRHFFLDHALSEMAYQDKAMPIGEGQTISQPYTVAFQRILLEVAPHLKVLEIGTGSGYQAAILAELVQAVFSIERIRSLADAAAARLSALGYRNVTVRSGEGRAGWPAEAPFDGILVTAAGDDVPQALLEQLRPGGFLVLPVRLADGRQMLRRITQRADGGALSADILPVAFVPLV